MAEEREAVEDWLAGECLERLKLSPFGYELEEARDICEKKEVRDKITEIAEQVVSGLISDVKGGEMLDDFLKERFLPKPPPPPKVRKIPRPRVAPPAPPAPHDWDAMAERILTDHPDMLAIASLGDIQRLYGPELNMSSRDLPDVADILDSRLKEMGRKKMKAPKNVREFLVGWVMATCSSQIVEINVTHAIDEMWSDIRYSIKHNFPDIFEEIEPVTYKIALEGYVMHNLGVEPEQMPKNVRKAYETTERRFG